MFPGRNPFLDQVRLVAFRHLPDHFPPDVTLAELGFDPFWHLLLIDVPGAPRVSEDTIDGWQTLGDIQCATRAGPPAIIVHQHGIAVRIDPIHIRRQTYVLPPRFALSRLGTDSDTYGRIAGDLSQNNGHAPLCLVIPQSEWRSWSTLEDILSSAERHRYWAPA